jgi:hypothetical protein
MAARFKAKIETQHGPRTCFQAKVQREGRKPLVARFGGIPLKRQKTAVLTDRLSMLMSAKCSSQMVLGLAAWTAASATARRAAGVTAADAALVYLGGLQRLDEDQGTLGTAEAAGAVAEDRAGLLAVAEQRAQGGDGLGGAGCRAAARWRR